MKKCSKCKEIKEFLEFSKDSSRKDGWCSACKICSKRRNNKWRAKNRTKIRPENSESKKKCGTCKEIKDFGMFGENKSAKDGRYGECRACGITRSSKWRTKNPEKSKENSVEWRVKNPEKFKASYTKYKTDNSGKVNADNANRRARKSNATLKWVNLKEIEKIFKNCPSGHHVDHIIPLNNILISGLHIPCNLQYLKAADNIKKGNKFDGTSENESWREGVNNA